MPRETQLTRGPGGRILTNCNIWSPDGEWIVYDTRSDPAGDRFDGTRIEMVHTHTGDIRTLYESKNGAFCGVATWHPIEPKIVFILGPEFPTSDWNYGPSHRQGVIVDVRSAGVAVNMDARDLVPPFTPGALRGGSHVHVWHPLGDWIAFTYEDALENLGRCIGVAVPAKVVVPKTHPRNHDGEYFSQLATRNEYGRIRSCEEAWVGTSRQLAFQGELAKGLREVFIVDAGFGAYSVRRLTFTENDRYHGLSGPRHWLRSSPDGSHIGFLKKDDQGIVQFWTVSPDDPRDVRQITHGSHPVASAFTWHPDGKHVAFVMNNAVCLCNVDTWNVQAMTSSAEPIRPEACVLSPQGDRIAFVRHVEGINQICVVTL